MPFARGEKESEYFCCSLKTKGQQLLKANCRRVKATQDLALWFYGTTQCAYIIVRWLWTINLDDPMTNFLMC